METEIRSNARRAQGEVDTLLSDRPELAGRDVRGVMSETKCPKSPHATVRGMVWFARMLDKIRLHDCGELADDYVPYLGIGFDGRCLRFLRIDYDALIGRTLSGGSDEEILQWCGEHGRELSDEDIQVWNGFLSKRGWRDGEDVSRNLDESKAAGGLEGREDILTYFDYNDADEGREE